MPKIVREFNEKIVVCKKQKSDNSKRTQAVEIIYNCKGAISDFAQEEAA